MQITEIVQQKNKNRFNVFVDGVFWVGISASVLASNNLYSGKDIESTELRVIFLEELEHRLYDRTLRLLGVRPRSQREIELFLKRVLQKKNVEWLGGSMYEHDKEIIHTAYEHVLDRLKEQGLIDDEAFAKWWVEARKRNGKKSWMIVKSELIQKGVTTEIIDRLTYSDKDEFKLAYDVYKKFCIERDLPREKCIRRLLSRGFSYEIIQKIMKEYGVSLD